MINSMSLPLTVANALTKKKRGIISLKCAIDLESWFRIKCCQHVENHHYTTNVRNDAMKLM